MKRSLALALATFLGLGLLSTSFAAFAQDAYGGLTSGARPRMSRHGARRSPMLDGNTDRLAFSRRGPSIPRNSI